MCLIPSLVRLRLSLRLRLVLPGLRVHLCLRLGRLHVVHHVRGFLLLGALSLAPPAKPGHAGDTNEQLRAPPAEATAAAVGLRAELLVGVPAHAPPQPGGPSAMPAGGGRRQVALSSVR